MLDHLLYLGLKYFLIETDNLSEFYSSEKLSILVDKPLAHTQDFGDFFGG